MSSSPINLQIPGVTWSHVLAAAGSAVGLAGASAISNYSSKIAAGLPDILRSMRTHEVAVCVFLSTLAFLPLAENRAFCKAKLQEFWSSIPSNKLIKNQWDNLAKSSFVRKNFRALNSVPNSFSRALEGGSYLFVATAIASMGLAILRSSSWMSELKANGIALSMILMGIKGLHQYSAELSGSRLGGK